MSNNFTEFEEIKRNRAKKKLKKKILYGLTLFLAIFFICFFYRNNYHSKIVNNVSGIFKVFRKGLGYPIRLNVTGIKDKSKIGSGVVVLDEDIIYIFNKHGYKTLYAKHNLNDPRVVSNRGRAVVFEHLGKKLKVYSKTQELVEKELDNLIYNVRLFDDNKIAIIKGSNRFISSLEIWDDDYNPIFKWNSSDKYMTLISMAKNNKNFATLSLSVDGVEYVSTVSFFNVNDDKKISELNLKDETIISLEYKDNNVLAVGTKAVYLINSRGNIIKQYDYDDKVIKAFDSEFSKNTILVVDNYNKTEKSVLILLNDQLKEVLRKEIKGKIKDITGDKKDVYILIDEEILKLNLLSYDLKKYNVESMISDIIFVNDKLYKLGDSKIDILKLSDYIKNN